MSLPRPAASPPVRGRPSAELVPPATGPDPGKVDRRPPGAGASSVADASPPFDRRRPSVPVDGSPSSRASSGASRKRHKLAAPDAPASSSGPPSGISREALEYELARAHERLAVLRAVVTFDPPPHTSSGSGTVQDAEGHFRGPPDTHAARAPRSWCLSKDLAQGSTPQGDLVFSGSYVELELKALGGPNRRVRSWNWATGRCHLQAAASQTALTALSRVPSSRPTRG